MPTGDTYQSPAFGWLHEARRVGSAGITTTASVLSTAPKTRLIDGMSRRNMVFSASGDSGIDLDRGATPRRPVNRLVIPAGHTLAGYRIQPAKSATGAFAGEQVAVVPYARIRTTASNNVYPTIRPGLNVFDFDPIQHRYIRIWLSDGPPSNVPALGELWLTQMHVPTVGFDARTFKRTHIPNTEVQTFTSGAQSVLERGQIRRRWAFDTSQVFGADRDIYTTMLNEAGVVRDRIIVDPPDANYETVIQDGASHALWTSAVGVASKADDTFNHTAGASSIRIETAGTVAASVYYDFSTPVDLRRKIIGADFRADTSTAWMTTTTGVTLRLYTGAGFVDVKAGTNLFRSANNWFTLWFDVDSETPSAASSGSLNPGSLERVWITADTTTAGIFLNFSNVRVVDKDAAPLIARLEEPVPESQANGNPSANGNAYTHSLSFLEAIE